MIKHVAVAMLLGGAAGALTGAAPSSGGPPTCLSAEVTIFAVRGEPTTGTAGPDVILGTGGPDVIDAGRGADRVCAGGGDDVVSGEGGRDRLLGGRGEDRLDGGDARDRCILGPGNGTLIDCERPRLTPTITIDNFAFTDAEVPVGTAVVVTNLDSAGHTWTSTEGVFDSPLLGTGSSYRFTVREPGEYSFFCRPHSFMTGTLTVTG
jgi:Ca2+-binding RTX toxin-like protein